MHLKLFPRSAEAMMSLSRMETHVMAFENLRSVLGKEIVQNKWRVDKL